MLLHCIDADPEVEVMDRWKSFNVADAIIFIQGAVRSLKPQTVNACWKVLCEIVRENEVATPSLIEEQVVKITAIAKKVGGDGLSDLNEDELMNFIDEPQSELTDKELEEFVMSSTEQEEDVREVEIGWTSEKFGEVFRLAQHLKDKILEYDPIMERSSKVSWLIM